MLKDCRKGGKGRLRWRNGSLSCEAPLVLIQSAVAVRSRHCRKPTVGLGGIRTGAQSQHELQIVENLKNSHKNVEIKARRSIDQSYDSSGGFLEPSWWRRALSALCGPRVEAVLASHNQSLSDVSTFAAMRNLGS